MLVLSRNEGEIIWIDFAGQRVKLTVAEVRRNGVCRLGFEADKSVKIYRAEVAERIEEQRQEKLLAGAIDLSRDNGCPICRDPNCDNPGGKH